MPELRSGYFDAHPIADPEVAEHPSYAFWKEQGGTPYGLDPKLSAIPITPEMRLWLRFNADLVGGADSGGCHFVPSEVRAVLDEHEEALLVWVETFTGAPRSAYDAREIARRLLRDIGSGLAMARNEMMDRSQSGTGPQADPLAKMKKLEAATK